MLAFACVVSHLEFFMNLFPCKFCEFGSDWCGDVPVVTLERVLGLWGSFVAEVVSFSGWLWDWRWFWRFRGMLKVGLDVGPVWRSLELVTAF